MIDYEALDAQTFLPRAVGRHDAVTAEFPDLAAAHHACQALHDAGIDDGCVALLGQRGDEVNTAWGLNADEQLMMGVMGRRIAAGAGLGVLAGSVVGLLLGVLVTGTGTALWAAILAEAVFGAGIGALIGGTSASGLLYSEVALHRGHPELEHALLGIESTATDEVARAVALLNALAPVRVELHERAAAAA